MAIYNIILEGPDGVGKSTIANLVACKLRAELRHCVPIKDKWKANVCADRCYFEMRENSGVYTVTDRWFGISDMIYNPEARVEDLMFLVKQFAISADQGISAMPVFLVVDESGESALAKRIEQRGDQYYSAHEILQFNSKYRELASLFLRCNVPCVVISLSAKALQDEDISAQISDKIQELACGYILANIVGSEEQWIEL